MFRFLNIFPEEGCDFVYQNYFFSLKNNDDETPQKSVNCVSHVRSIFWMHFIFPKLTVKTPYHDHVSVWSRPSFSIRSTKESDSFAERPHVSQSPLLRASST